MDDEGRYALFNGDTARVFRPARILRSLSVSTPRGTRVADGFGRWIATSKRQQPVFWTARDGSTEDALPLD